ncbi:MAG: hypothetical protein WC789_05520 [Lentisphaeria bacterium]|jgi:hypothetical protein
MSRIPAAGRYRCPRALPLLALLAALLLAAPARAAGEDLPLLVLHAAEQGMEPAALRTVVLLLREAGQVEPAIGERLAQRLADGGWKGAVGRYLAEAEAFGLAAPELPAGLEPTRERLTEELRALLSRQPIGKRLALCAQLAGPFPGLTADRAFANGLLVEFLRSLTPQTLGAALQAVQKAAKAAPADPLLARLAAATAGMVATDVRRQEFLERARQIREAVLPRYRELEAEFNPRTYYERSRLEAMATPARARKQEEFNQLKARLQEAAELDGEAGRLPTVRGEAELLIAELTGAVKRPKKEGTP